MTLRRRVKVVYKALFQLGLREIFYYLIYKAGVFSNFFKFSRKNKIYRQLLHKKDLSPNWFWKIPDLEKPPSYLNSAFQKIIQTADRVCEGKTDLFGSVESEITLSPAQPLHHWTYYEKRTSTEKDIKFIWEPARFGFAVTLGQAYAATKIEKYCKAFMKYFEVFQNENPFNMGPNWQSGQEISLRIIAWIIAVHLFRNSSLMDSDYLFKINTAISEHASRIPQTISYAKAQGNNHLLSEAAGLYTAGIFLRDHPHATRWRRLGKRWFNQAIIQQIAFDGEYCQHSTNYHRLMLTLCLWMKQVMESNQEYLTKKAREKITKSVQWLNAHTDLESGNTVNLGHNDGAFILPFDPSDYTDYRPILQAVNLAFCESSFFEPGLWDMQSLWMNQPLTNSFDSITRTPTRGYLRIENDRSWAMLRAAKYRNRPAHADQLSVNIWHKGHPLTLDAGTYLYNADPPWKNALAETAVHNTVLVDHADQMLRAGKFLWLDWAQGKILNSNKTSICAQHDGYRGKNLIHFRELRFEEPQVWFIEDDLKPISHMENSHQVQLHWLLPDYSYEIFDNKIELKAPFGLFSLSLSQANIKNRDFISFIRGGKTIQGSYQNSHMGWFSPTYAVKIPALSIVYQVEGEFPLKLLSKFVIN